MSDWKKNAMVGDRSVHEWWVRYTTPSGLFYWYHPDTGWVGEPHQIEQPSFQTRGEAYHAMETAPPPPEADREHEWFNSGLLSGAMSCRKCGIVKRSKGLNKPCRGHVRVGPRADPKDTRIAELERVLVAAIRLRFAYPPVHRFECAECQEIIALFDAIDRCFEGANPIARQEEFAAPVKKWITVNKARDSK